VVFGHGEKPSDGIDGRRGNDRAVGGGDGDVSAGGAEGFRQVVASGFGADQEEAGGAAVGLVGVREQRFGERFGDGLGWGEVWGETDGGEGSGGGWPDGGYFGWMWRGGNPSPRIRTRGTRFCGWRGEAAVEGFYRIGAGE